MSTATAERPVSVSASRSPESSAGNQAALDGDITAVPRALIMFGARVLSRLERALVAEENRSTAQGNAWAAVCADRARAAARADLGARLRAHR